MAGTTGGARRESGQVLAAASGLAALAAALLLGLGVLVLVLGRLPNAHEQVMLPAAVAGAAVAAVANGPLRAAFTRATRRTARGGRRSPESVLEAFGDRAARELPADELLRRLAEALRDSLGLATVEVWTRDEAGLGRLLSLPHRAAAVPRLGPAAADALQRSGVAGEAWLRLWVPELLEGRGDAQVRVAPAAFGPDLLALLVVERPREAERFRPGEERALGEVVGRLGVVLHNRALDAALQTTLDDLREANAELTASRARLVSAADAERRRIERDIHDGAQQHLAALAVNLGLARTLLGGDPDDTGRASRGCSTRCRPTCARRSRRCATWRTASTRRCSGRPACPRPCARPRPAAPTRSPSSWPASTAGRSPTSRPRCTSARSRRCRTSPSTPRTRRATVRLGTTGGLLVLEVEDDGPGYDPGADAAGQGRQNMTDRVGAVGGAVRVDTVPGRGTVVRAEVPVPVRAG